MFSELATLASSQFGVFTRKQALDFLSKGQLDTLIRSKVISRAQPSVYRISGSPNSWEQDALAAALSIRRSALSHFSAAWLWGLHEERPTTLDLVAPSETRTTRDGIRVHQSVQLLGRITMLNGIPVTDVARTLVDLSGVTRLGPLAKCLDTALRLRLVQLSDVSKCLDEMVTQGRSRITSLRQLLDERNENDEKSESGLEKQTLRWIREAGLEEPTAQFWVTTPQRRYRLDHAWVDLKVNVESDGGQHLSPVHAEEDRVRDARLTAMGWVVVRRTKHADQATFIRNLSLILRNRRTV